MMPRIAAAVIRPSVPITRKTDLAVSTFPGIRSPFGIVIVLPYCIQAAAKRKCLDPPTPFL